MPAIFIVDDDDDILCTLELWFKKKNYDVTTFSSGNTLLEEVQKQKPDLIILDVNLKGEDGRYICHDIKTKARYPVKVLLLSANPLALLTYQENYADGIINKPFGLAELERKCLQLLPHKRTWLD